MPLCCDDILMGWIRVSRRRVKGILTWGAACINGEIAFVPFAPGLSWETPISPAVGVSP